MKDKLEVGMYVRTKYGISQYKQHKVIGSEDIRGILCKDGSRVIFANIEDIIGKPSHNIIDLIEVGDYVNGQRVDTIQNGQLLSTNSHDFWLENIVSCNEDIKSIVTKEMFSSMEYRLGDDK